LEKQSELEAAYGDLREIEDFIDHIDDTRLKEIMTFRFIYGETWNEVAKHFGYHESDESVRKAVNRYLQNVNKIGPI
jgi:glutamine synthetase adenylyltransferase